MNTKLRMNMAGGNQIEKNYLLQLLKTELGFLDAGGYGSRFRSQWRPTLLLRDSPACINYSDTGRQRPCSECPLLALVPAEKKDRLIPCHFIPLNEGGMTVAGLYAEGSQDLLDQHYRNWLTDITRKLETSS
jgi:hypothetical protein